MGKRQRAWARQAYDKLIVELGGKCKGCGADADLTIHHVYGCEYEHRTIEWSARVSRYRREAKEGLLEVLCDICNKKKGHPDSKDLPDTFDDAGNLFQNTTPLAENEPF